MTANTCLSSLLHTAIMASFLFFPLATKRSNYATSVIDIFVSYEELRPFANIHGHLKPFYDE
jgi:hypothetical protein